MESCFHAMVFHVMRKVTRNTYTDMLTMESVILIVEVDMPTLALVHRDLFEISFSTAAFRMSIPGGGRYRLATVYKFIG